MKKLLLAVLFMMMSLLSLPVMAEVDTQGLTETQKAQLIIQAEEMKKASNETQAVSPKKVDEVLETANKWAELGKGIAVGVGAGAKEIGVAVNDFADSRVGRITTYIIVWKYLGKDILGVAMALFIFIVIMPALWFTFKHLCFKYEYENASFFGIPYRTKKSSKMVDNETSATIFFSLLVAELVVFVIAIIMLPF